MAPSSACAGGTGSVGGVRCDVERPAICADRGRDGGAGRGCWRRSPARRRHPQVVLLGRRSGRQRRQRRQVDHRDSVVGVEGRLRPHARDSSTPVPGRRRIHPERAAQRVELRQATGAYSASTRCLGDVLLRRSSDRHFSSSDRVIPSYGRSASVTTKQSLHQAMRFVLGRSSPSTSDGDHRSCAVVRIGEQHGARGRSRSSPEAAAASEALCGRCRRGRTAVVVADTPAGRPSVSPTTAATENRRSTCASTP